VEELEKVLAQEHAKEEQRQTTGADEGGAG